MVPQNPEEQTHTFFGVEIKFLYLRLGESAKALETRIDEFSKLTGQTTQNSENRNDGVACLAESPVNQSHLHSYFLFDKTT